MKKEEFVMLRDFIYEKTGIFFPENKSYLMKNRLQGRLKDLNLNSFEDYYYFLKYKEKGSNSELFKLFDVITTNETSFFRNPPQFDAFKTIVCNMITNKKNSFLRIWSAACSTGEEPYTIAIVLLETMEKLKKKLPFLIYATDISRKVLESAKKGQYNSYSMRNVDCELRKKYFLKKDNFYHVKEDLKSFVKIEFSNLVDFSEYSKFNHMDFIFCRNVLIYFGEPIKRKVVEHLYECLNPGGYLILGHAEILHTVTRIFKPLMFPGAIVYKKG